MNPENLLENLRRQPFYRGQILRVRQEEGRDAAGCALPALLERVPSLRNGSCQGVFRTLGMDEPYALYLAALRRAFPSVVSENRDIVALCSKSLPRERLWQAVCLLESLDFSRVSIVLCSNRDRLSQAAIAFAETVRKADIEYALPVRTVRELQDLHDFALDSPLVMVMVPETLREFLLSPACGDLREEVLPALGRIALPCLDEWPPALASNTAYLLRMLHVECAQRGTHPALVATSSPIMEAERFASEFWGRTVPGQGIIRDESVESPPIWYVNYSGAMVRDASNTQRWVREPHRKVAEDLLGWLASPEALGKYTGVELHYVLDVSGSMAECLGTVGEAVIRDFRMKLDAGTVSPGDHVKLTVFNTAAELRYPVEGEGEIDENTLHGFSAAVKSLTAGGGTDLPVALGAAMESALSGGARVIDVILFSDGESPVIPSQKSRLLRLVRQACSDGRSLGLLYVVLDSVEPPMDPPIEIRNLITEMGGRLVAKSIGSLSTPQEFSTGSIYREAVLFLSGEKGLPEEVVQSCQGGMRQVIFSRDSATLLRRAEGQTVDPRSIVAVVVSGRFSSLSQVHDQVRHLGRCELPVFLLDSGEAWGQMLAHDIPEARRLCLTPLICSDNAYLRNMRLAELLGEGELPIEVFRYLADGPSAYPTMKRYLEPSGTAVPTAHEAGSDAGIPAGFEAIRREEGTLVCAVPAARTGRPGARPLDTWTDDLVPVEGASSELRRDRATAPLLWHRGAVLDLRSGSTEVKENDGRRVLMDPRSADHRVPILESLTVTSLRPETWQRTMKEVDRLGSLSLGPVVFEATVAGTRVFPASNLDDAWRDERTPGQAARVRLETVALRWDPLALSGEAGPLPMAVLTGLANLLRLSGVGVFRYADQALLAYPAESGTIWVLDLAPGGTGASALLYNNPGAIGDMLATGGRVLLECPCEGGFASASTANREVVTDGGCPRCVRVTGPVIARQPGSPEDICAAVSKQHTLAWLLQHAYLPGSGGLHLTEKYGGIEDISRITGGDSMSRRGCITLIRSILRDRLGLATRDDDIGAFSWLPENTDGVLGTYDDNRNTLAILKGLREWFALDVLAHEVFHNYQARCRGLFNYEVLGGSGSARPPFGGKLFTEGAAVWAESHIVDALAIRSSLTAANLRQGDEYAVGFQLLKFIEEQYGVHAVLEFLHTGDVRRATNPEGAEGRGIASLHALYEAAGIRHLLKP